MPPENPVRVGIELAAGERGERSMSENDSAVVDDVERHRFLYRQEGLESQLVYRVDGGHLILVHTEVPEALSGRGIGGSLVGAAIERAAVSGEILVPWCPYARKWLTDHPDLADRVDIDWEQPPAEARHPPGAAPPQSAGGGGH